MVVRSPAGICLGAWCAVDWAVSVAEDGTGHEVLALAVPSGGLPRLIDSGLDLSAA